MKRLLIKNVNILTMDKNKTIIEDGVVIVNDGKIEAVGSAELTSKYRCENVIDGKGGILIPGMVNTHTHASMVVFRSLGDDIPDRLKRYIFPLEKTLMNKSMVSLGARYGIAEMLMSGVTTFADMYYFEDEVAKAAKEMGIRAVLGETVVNFPSPDSNRAYGGLEYGEEFIKKWKNDDLVTPSIAPHAPYSNDTEHLEKASLLASKYDVPMMMHLEEMDYEMKKYKDEYDMTPVEYLDSIGVLNERFIAAHLIYANDKDINIMKERNMGVAHNIGANAKAAKGVPPLKKMCEKKMRVGLGTDGPMSGNTLDIITQMSLIAKIHKLYNKDRSLFPASEIVEMATMGGARALNLDKCIGSIEPHKKADMVIIETSSVNMQPIYDYYSVLVYSANAGNVDTVIVDGKVVVSDKKLVNCNLKELADELKSVGGHIFVSAKKLG